MAFAFYNNPQNIEDFVNKLQTNCENDIKNIKTNKNLIEKTNDDIPDVPNFKDYNLIYENNYNVQQLKNFTKIYKLKISGNKKELILSKYKIFLQFEY